MKIYFQTPKSGPKVFFGVMSKTKVARNLILIDFDLKKVRFGMKTDDLGWWSDLTPPRTECVVQTRKCQKVGERGVLYILIGYPFKGRRYKYLWI